MPSPSRRCIPMKWRLHGRPLEAVIRLGAEALRGSPARAGAVEVRARQGDRSQGDKQKDIEALLTRPDPRSGGMLSAGDFALLKMVYERPILKMGKELAGELMESTGQALRESRSTVTLTAD